MSRKVAYLTGSDVVVLLDCEEIHYSTGHVPAEEVLEARNLAADIFEDLDHLAVELLQADGKLITLQSATKSRVMKMIFQIGISKTK